MKGVNARASAELGAMTTAVIRSFKPELGLVRGSDRSIVPRLERGEPSQFELVSDRHGQGCAVDIAPL